MSNHNHILLPPLPSWRFCRLRSLQLLAKTPHSKSNQRIHFISPPKRLRKLREPHWPSHNLTSPYGIDFPWSEFPHKLDVREQQSQNDHLDSVVGALSMRIQCQTGVLAGVDCSSPTQGGQKHGRAGPDEIICEVILVVHRCEEHRFALLEFVRLQAVICHAWRPPMPGRSMS